MKQKVKVFSHRLEMGAELLHELVFDDAVQAFAWIDQYATELKDYPTSVVGPIACEDRNVV